MVIGGACDEAAALVDDPGVRRRTLGHQPIRIYEPSVIGGLGARGLLGQRRRQQHYRLDVASLPAIVGHSLDGDALGSRSLPFALGYAARQAHYRRWRTRWRK